MRTLSPYGELQIKEIDEKIARLEQSIAAEQERRREVINRYGLNKCQGGMLKSDVTYVVGEKSTESLLINLYTPRNQLCVSGIHAYELGSYACTLCGCKQQIDDQHSHLCD